MKSDSLIPKAARDKMRTQCAPISPGIVQPTADAMVIALCAHADAMDLEIADLEAERETLRETKVRRGRMIVDQKKKVAELESEMEVLLRERAGERI